MYAILVSVENEGEATAQELSRQRFAHVEVAAHAFMVGAGEGKHRFGIRQIHGVFDVARLVNAAGVEVRQFHRQRFQLGKPLRQIG